MASTPSYVIAMRREMDVCFDAIKNVLRCERCEWMKCIYHTSDIADRRKEIQALRDFQVHNCDDYPEKRNRLAECDPATGRFVSLDIAK
jgi:hypothetical protein